MFMVREDGTWDKGEGVIEESRECGDSNSGVCFSDENQESDDTDDPKIAEQNCCRICASKIGINDRIAKITEKKISRAFQKLYNINIHEEADYMPKNIHRKCEQVLLRNLSKTDKKSPVNPPLLPKLSEISENVWSAIILDIT